MSKANRASNMTNIVFRKDNIEQLRRAFNVMCDTWLEIATEKGQGQSFTIREVQTALDMLLQKNWKTIQDVFLKDNYHDYKSGSFTKDEQSLHAKLIMDLIKHVDDGYMEIKAIIDELYDKEKSLKTAIQALQCENVKLQDDVTQDKWKLNRAVTDSNNSVGRITQLEQLNKEKTDIIVQLQRDATVELWGKEKQKILDKASENDCGSEELTKQHGLEKTALRDKIKDLEIQMKKAKMSAQLRNTQEDKKAGLEEEKKYSFLLETDLRRFDEELFNLQKQIVGLLGGLSTKFSPSFRKFRRSEEPIEMDESTRDEFARVEDVLQESHQAASEGTLGEYIKKLGIYYQAQDSQVRRLIVRRITACHNINGRLSPVMSKRGSPLVLPELITEVRKPNTMGRFPLTKQLSKADLKDSGIGDIFKPTIITTEVIYPRGNPKLLNEVTNEVNMITVLKYFPFLLKEDIEDSWEQFRRYDKNDDGTLDLTEVTTAMANCFGDAFRAPQIRDAMLEVDNDGSGDLDFFEFISVVNMLKNRSGRAEVYRSTAVQDKSRKMSKVCLLM